MLFRSASARWLLSVTALVGYVLTKISVTIYAGAVVFQVLMGIDFWTGALVVVVLTGVYTVLGVSNCSFGLKPAARHVLNSVFLEEAVEAGLDSAIVHAGKIVPLARIDEEHVEVCRDIIHDRRSGDYDPLARLIELFEDVESVRTVKEDRSDWPVDRRLAARIIDADRDGLHDDLDLALESMAALDIINDEIGRAHV